MSEAKRWQSRLATSEICSEIDIPIQTMHSLTATSRFAPAKNTMGRRHVIFSPYKALPLNKFY
jgi:hypothetical protein